MHGTAKRGFEEAAAAYERARPPYPDDAVDWIARGLRIEAGQTVVELGAGTGKFTRTLLPAGARIVALEPLDGMRAFLARSAPGVAVAAGTAEAIPLRTGSTGAVVAAQAFHWFDPGRTLPEIHRILHPGGRLGLVWNIRDSSEPWVAALWSIIDIHQGDAPNFREGEWRSPFESSPLFGPLRERRFRNRQILAPATLLERVASISYIATLPAQRREAVLDEARRLLATHPDLRGRGSLTLPYHTLAYWTERRNRGDGV